MAYGKAKIVNVTKGFVPLLVILMVFTVSVFTTTGGDVAESKLFSTVRHGVMVYFAFALMFSNLEKFDFGKLGMLFLVLAVFLVPMSIVTNGISGPNSLTDFGFLRYQTHEDFIGTETDEELHVSYQATGILLLQALGFYLVDSKNSKLISVVLVFAISFIAQLYVGSRQAIVSIIVIAIAWALLYNNRERKRKSSIIIRIGLLIIVLIVSYFVITILTAEDGLLNSVAEEGYIEGGGRGAWLLSGVDQFLSSPIWGVGYGRFIIFGEYGSYPHNLFVELLCETGLVGFSIASILAIWTVFQVKKAALPFLVLFLAYFLRSMASGSLSLNITVFAMLFAMISLIPTKVHTK